MQKDILRHPNIKKIVLKYTDGKNVSRIEEVKLRFIDKKTCLFIGRVLPNFVKPRWRAKAVISIYTSEGIYNSEVIIRGVEFAFAEITYELDIPKEWKFGQLRAGVRKNITLPLTLTFNDGLEIKARTVDLSIGGCSVVVSQDLSELHKKVDCKFKIAFPPELNVNFPDGVLEGNAIFVRGRVINDVDELKNAKVLCFKFKNLSPNKILILKNFLTTLSL